MANPRTREPRTANRGPSHVFEIANAAYRQLVGHREIIGKTVRDRVAKNSNQQRVAGYERPLTQFIEASGLASSAGGVVDPPAPEPPGRFEVPTQNRKLATGFIVSRF